MLPQTAPTLAPGDTSAPTVFSGLALSGSAKISANTPKGFDTLQVPTTVYGSPAQLSQLVKVVQSISENHPLDGFDATTQAALAKAFDPAQLAALRSGKAPAALQNEAIAWAWKGALGEMKNIGISTSAFPDLVKTPTVANATSKLQELGSIPLEAPLTHALCKAGYDTKGMSNVQTLVSGHDADVFDATKQGQNATVASTGAQTAAQEWDSFVTDWNANKNNYQHKTLHGPGRRRRSGHQRRQPHRRPGVSRLPEHHPARCAEQDDRPGRLHGVGQPGAGEPRY